MHSVYDFDKLKQLLNNLYIITGRKFTLKSSEFDDVMTGHSQCEFCTLIQNKEDGYQKCLDCNKTALQHTQAINKPYMFRCHCGLVEVAIPIMNGNTLLAFLMFGQVLDNSPIDQQWKVTKRLCSWHNDVGRLKEAFYKLHCLNEKELSAYTDVLAACASYIWLQDYVQQSELTDSEKVVKYIDSHYDKKLSLNGIAHALGMSKTKLCETARHSGFSINAEITTRRMEAAKKLIATTDRPIYAIADTVGIGDYSYFSRLFKEYSGLTPNQYRKISKSNESSKEIQL